MEVPSPSKRGQATLARAAPPEGMNFSSSTHLGTLISNKAEHGLCVRERSRKGGSHVRPRCSHDVPSGTQERRRAP